MMVNEYITEDIEVGKNNDPENGTKVVSKVGFN